MQLALRIRQKPLACPRPEGGDSDVDFDELIDRRGTGTSKWDLMEPALGVPAADGLAMWIADMDYATPSFLKEAVQSLLDRDSYGYFCGLESFTDAISWWMRERHGWSVEADEMFTTFGLGNGIGIALQALTEPGTRLLPSRQSIMNSQ